MADYVTKEKFNESMKAIVISQLVTVNTLYHALDKERSRLMRFAKVIGITDEVILNVTKDN